MLMRAFIFPGQGSQKQGMGEDLFEAFPELTDQASQILGYSIRELCLRDPQRQLAQTQYTQPALYVICVLSYLAEVSRGIRPDFVAGHSVGEYSALFAADVFDFETGLRLVQKRGELMAKAQNGGMAAVGGLSEAQIRSILNQHQLYSLDIANLNAPTQVVLSGPNDDIIAAQAVFEAAQAQLYIKLNVSGAFHSRYMNKSRDEFGTFIASMQFAEPRIPVIANLDANPYTASTIKRNLVEQITHSVRWVESIEYLLHAGVNEFKEIGPGTVLTKLNQRITANQAATPTVSTTPTPQPLPNKPATPTPPTQPTLNGSPTLRAINPLSLGSEAFRRAYGVKYAYAAGGMHHGIASIAMIERLAQAKIMSFFGTGGLALSEIEQALQQLQQRLGTAPYGVNLLWADMQNPEHEAQVFACLERYSIHHIEVAGYLDVTPALLRFRAKGLTQHADGSINSTRTIMAKITRPEIAEVFLSPPTTEQIQGLVAAKLLTSQQAQYVASLPIADDICVEADSGGTTGLGSAYALLPTIIQLRDRAQGAVRIGGAGGIGTPAAAAAAFMLGADFILTGSINQCTVEAKTSNAAKELLQDVNPQDTIHIPNIDLLSPGSKTQVLKKGVFFHVRANRLYDISRFYENLEQLDQTVRQQIEEKYFKRTLADIWRELCTTTASQIIERAERNPRQKLALTFKWYFDQSIQWAIHGDLSRKVDFQIACGPALGAFNQWVKGTPLERWQARHVDTIADSLMHGTADYLNQRMHILHHQ
uniref:[acyl-carrier-protein] S-malonyltransferase n=1 Tax=Herpetosiphon sp. B060 TaxID=2002978 RepID=A0A2Z2H198_9CHLR|nr:SphA [Herpetosiphon sp. B060]